jgi:predicted secreted protein
MKTLYNMAIILVVAVLFLTTACQKDASGPTLRLTAVDTGTMHTMMNGGNIQVTLDNPGASGYSFNTWQYDTTVLKLLMHSHLGSSNPADYGSDTWEFNAIGTGKTNLMITASKGAASISTIIIFCDSIRVR